MRKIELSLSSSESNFNNLTTLFDELNASIDFETLGKGRCGAMLVKSIATETTTDEHDELLVPIVRTTTMYTRPPQEMNAIHAQLIAQVGNDVRRTLDVDVVDDVDLNFNNVMAERYTHDYTNMSFHSDQALDLRDSSFIAILSLYSDAGAAGANRSLILRRKDDDSATVVDQEIIMSHGSIVCFSVPTNQQWLHKIVLRSPPRQSNHVQWLGLTMRVSKTFVSFRADQTPAINGVALTLATDDELREFRRLRGAENRNSDPTTSVYVDHPIHFTISASDLMRPVTMTMASRCQPDRSHQP
jgi:alkylated DNA repair dioxygenase AlkB